MFHQRVDVRNIFIEVYKAYPVSYIGRDDVECTNSVILPPSALAKFTSMRQGFSNKSDPVLFRILNIDLNIYTHCGVIDFTAEEEVCYLPTNMFNRLYLAEGQMVNLRNVKLECGKFLKIQPHKTEFIEQPNPKVILENGLRNYFCVTEGDTIAVEFRQKKYNIDIVECKPKKAVLLLNRDIEVDFAPPKDYNEGEKNVTKETQGKTSIDYSKGEEKKHTQEELRKKLEDQKFFGHHTRLDGKKFTENQIKKVEKQKTIKNNEEGYNPRENRIESKNRAHFHYVGGLGEFAGVLTK